MTPTPGSEEAREQGCCCPVIDNGHGHGHGTVVIDGAPTVVFVMRAECPIHGKAVGFDWKNQ